MGAFTEEQNARLAAPLNTNRVKQRQSGNGSLSYLETHDVIRTANDIFGFGQWGHDIVELRPIEPVTVTNRDGKTGLQVGYLCIIRLTVNGCPAVSGVGYGDAIEYRASAPVTAHELAAKEAESDALKRALKNFGDQFGLALYDKAAASRGHLTTGAEPKPAAAKAAPPSQGEAAMEAAATAQQQKKLDRLIANLANIDPDHDWAAIAEKYCQREWRLGREQIGRVQIEQLVGELNKQLEQRQVAA